MRNISYLIYILLLITSCRGDESGREGLTPLNDNDYSGLFKIERQEAYSKLTVRNPWQGADNEIFVYYIADNPSVLPRGIDESQIIIRPVSEIICTSTTHISMLDALGCTDLVKGISGAEYVYNEKLRKRIEGGSVRDIGYENGYNSELIYSLAPDLILVYGIGSESFNSFERLSDLGLHVIFIADYLENHPLARMEWIKVYGELTGKQAMADELFNTAKDEYRKIVMEVSEAGKERPLVLMGLPFKDTWFISPGNSYISRLIEDAGGRYLWADNISDASIPMSLEAVCQEALSADIWLNTGTARSIEEIKMLDTRLADLPVISKGSLFNNIKRMNVHGGNDYWESGTVKPHVILKDIASIINPDLYPDHELVYYIKLEQ